MLRPIIISILLFSLGFSQNEEIKIAKVEVKGNEVTSKKTIIFTAGLREGQTITTADFPRAIKRLWQLNLFQDVQIHFNEETEEGLSITIEIKENFVLGEINYKGNKKVKDRKLKEEIELSAGQRIKPNTIHNTKELIREIYAEKGYLNVDIESQLTAPDNDLNLFGGKGKELVRDLTFEIKENKKVKIGKIIIEGNKRISKETIKIYGEIELKKDYSENDLDQILKNLYSTNFFEDVRVELNKNTLTVTLKEYPVVNQLIIFGEKSTKYKEQIKKLINLKENRSFVKSFLDTTLLVFVCFL